MLLENLTLDNAIVGRSGETKNTELLMSRTPDPCLRVVREVSSKPTQHEILHKTMERLWETMKITRTMRNNYDSIFCLLT